MIYPLPFNTWNSSNSATFSSCSTKLVILTYYYLYRPLDRFPRKLLKFNSHNHVSMFPVLTCFSGHERAQQHVQRARSSWFPSINIQPTSSAASFSLLSSKYFTFNQKSTPVNGSWNRSRSFKVRIASLRTKGHHREVVVGGSSVAHLWVDITRDEVSWPCSWDYAKVAWIKRGRVGRWISW